MTSILQRLSIGLAFSLIGVFMILGFGMSLSFRLLTDSYIATRLEHDTESLLAAIILNPDSDIVELRSGRMNPVYHQPFSGHYYRIDVDGTSLRSRSLWDQTMDVPKVAVGEMTLLRLEGPERQLLLVRVAAYEKAGRQVHVAVAEDLSPIRTEVRRSQLRYVLFGVGALLFLLLLQRHILRHGLRPLGKTREEIAELERGERQQLSETVPEELNPVVYQINRLLSTLQQRLSRSRNAMGNLAHAIKTPLTLLSQIADRDDAFHDRTAAEETRQLVERIRALTERELKRARLAGAAGITQRLALRHELDALGAVLQQLYRERGLRLELEIPEALQLAADREDMHELFGNLLDNACKWARSRVRVRAETDADGVTVRVEDDGPGRDPDELARLNLRGVRVDEDTTPGHGLGLAIVQDIVAHYGGRLHLDRSSELGGFCAEVWLPFRQAG